MHFEDLYKKKYSINSINFNKKLNWFFDIKYLNFRKLNNQLIKRQARQLSWEYKVLLKRKKVNKNLDTQVIKTKKFNTNRISKKIQSRNKILNSIKFIKKNNLDNYFKYFLIQGSVSNNEFVEKWSDIDTFVVLKNETILNYKNLIKLQKLLKIFYKLVLNFSPFQHHGVISFTELDLDNYKKGFLPPEALKENINIFKNEKIFFRKENDKTNLSYQILKERNQYIKKSITQNFYDHHVFYNKKMKVPLKLNDPTLHQLFCHIGFMLNLPILFLDSIGKSTHKKNSFKKFYIIINNKKVKNFIKKHERVRKNWKNLINNKKNINQKILNILGVDYMKECYDVMKIILKKIKIFTNTN
tara:strand:- start:2260 stop:3330 length:1071 start_codon:yes stop_codon:yes gene_type:complete